MGFLRAVICFGAMGGTGWKLQGFQGVAVIVVLSPERAKSLSCISAVARLLAFE